MLPNVTGYVKQARPLQFADHARMTIVPILLVVSVAIGVIVLIVLWSAHNTHGIAQDHERHMVSNALAEKKAHKLREIGAIAGGEDAVDNAWSWFRPSRIDSRISRPLTKASENEYVFIFDGGDLPVYAFAEQSRRDPEEFRSALEPISGAIARLRAPERAAKEADAGQSRSAPQALAEFVLFEGRPALLSAALIGPTEAGTSKPSGRAPILVSIDVVDARFVNDLGLDPGLANLRVSDAPGELSVPLAGFGDRVIGYIAWSPKQPNWEVLVVAWPFVITAVIGFALLGFFILGYMRMTSARISAGEHKLRHLALHDPLSELPNRAYFGDRLMREIEETLADGMQSAVLALDLDDFKDVNDTLGHHVGDALIGVVAQRLLRNLRAEDFVARLGGDEFAIITGGFARPEDCLYFAERLIAVLSEPYTIMGHSMVIGCSIGIAMIEGAGDPAGIMRRADVALYRAKSDGKNRACIYDDRMDADLRKRKQLENELARAITEEQLRLEYQPIMSAKGDRMIAVEALARWRHPERGAISPSEFIPIAEQSGLIIPLGEWVLRQACLDAKRWPDITLSVNVSALQFKRVDFVEVVTRILEETGFDPQRLELEVTESTLLGNVEQAGKVMKRLKDLGVRLALDDFGTGYSSLLYLRTFPFDKLKIDRSFVQSVKPASEAAAIVHAIVSLGRGLHMNVTAEGVETAEQHLFLRAAGVHSVQGFLFGKSESAQQVTAWLGNKPASAVKLAS